MAIAQALKGINARGDATTDPVGNFRFLVNFYPMSGAANAMPWKGRQTLGFSSVDGLNIAVDTVPIREGGYNATVHNIPIQITYQPVTLQRGMMIGAPQNWDWMRYMVRAVQGRPRGLSGLFRSDVEIAVLSNPIPFASGQDRIGRGLEALATDDDLVAFRFMLYSAYPGSIIWSSLNAMDNALFVESMTLAHEGLDMRWSEKTARGWSSAGDFYD